MRSDVSNLYKLVIPLTVFFVFSPVVLAEVRPITFPVQGNHSFRNDFAEPRGDGTREHLGIDIIAAKMTPAVAVADGRVVFIAIPEPSWGYAITIRDAEGYSYRYLHLNNDMPGTDDGAGGPANAYAAGLARGSSVSKGQFLGWVGDSGNAESTVSHLHFEMRNTSGTVINPYDSLLAAAGGVAGQQSGNTVVHGVVTTPEEELRFIGQLSLSEGMKDPEVVVLHGELKTLGYYTGELGNIYTPATREAVRRFQIAKGLTPNGIADELTRLRISEAVNALPLATTSTLSLGDSGEAVLVLQQTLKELGFFNVLPTGYFGPLTEAAVKAFQTAKGIEPLGFVGPKTRAALLVSAAPIAGPSPTMFVFTKYLSRGTSGNEVLELQQRLQTAGFFKDEPTGYFGAITETAVMSYQRSRGIDPAGVVGPATRAALNG